jgi:predicted RNase H-like nuclease (RuvC/YqgF family)
MQEIEEAKEIMAERVRKYEEALASRATQVASLKSDLAQAQRVNKEHAKEVRELEAQLAAPRPETESQQVSAVQVRAMKEEIQKLKASVKHKEEQITTLKRDKDALKILAVAEAAADIVSSSL